MSDTTPSASVRYGGFLLFFALMLGAALWFGWSFISLVSQILHEAPVIYFNKGALYMLGVAIGLLALVYAIFIEVILQQQLTENSSRMITRTAYIGIGVLVLFPQIIHFTVERNLIKKNYEICETASYQWLMYREIVFTRDTQTCKDITTRSS